MDQPDAFTSLVISARRSAAWPMPTSDADRSLGDGSGAIAHDVSSTSGDVSGANSHIVNHLLGDVGGASGSLGGR